MNKYYLVFLLISFIFSDGIYAAAPKVTPFNKETGQRILKATQKFGIVDEDLLTLILKSNPDLNIRDQVYNGTPLYWAAIKNRPTTVKILLNYSAKVNVVDKMGNTPLMGASKLGFIKIVQLLLPYSPDITIKNENGKDAIDLAEENGHSEIVDLLKKYRGDYVTLEWNDEGEDNIAGDIGNNTDEDDLISLRSASKIADGYKTDDMDLYGDIDLDGVDDSIDNDDDGDGVLDVDENKSGWDDKDADGTPDFIDRDGGTGKIDAGVSKLKDNNILDIAVKRFRKLPSDKDIKKVGLKKVGTETVDEDAIIKQLKNRKYNIGNIIDILRKDGQDIDRLDKETGMNMAHLAVLNEDFDLLNFLIGRGINFDKKDNKGFTPLMYAAMYGYKEMVKVLLLWSSDPFIKDNDGKTAKDLSHQKGHLPVYEYLKYYEDLIKSKKELEQRVKKRRKGILKAGAGLIGLKKLIEKKGSEEGFDKKDEKSGQSLIDHVKNNKGKIMALSNFLKNPKVDIDHKSNDDGETALHKAVKNNDIASAKELLENDADPNQQDHKGRTPLMIAVKGQNYDMVLLLLKYSPDINHKDRNRDDAINLAIKDKNDEILKLLNEYKKLLEDLIRKAKLEKSRDLLPPTLDNDKDKDGLDDDTEDPDKGTGRLSRNTSLWRSIGAMAMLRKQVEIVGEKRKKTLPKDKPLVKKVSVNEISISDFKVEKMGNSECVYKVRKTEIAPRKYKVEKIVFVKSMKIRLKKLPKERPLYFINLSATPMLKGQECEPRKCKDTNLFYGLQKRKLVFFQNKEVPLGPKMKDFIQVYEGVPNGDVVNVDITKCKNYPSPK